MKIRSTGLIVLYGLLTSFLAGCSTPNSPTRATLVNGRYENEFFDFTLKIPPGWTVNSERQFDEARKMSGVQPDTPAEERTMQNISHLLLFTSAHPGAATVALNPTIILSAVDIRGETNIQSAQAYERTVIQALDPRKWRQLGMPAAIKLGTKEFYRVDSITKAFQNEMDEAFFARIDKGYLLIMAVCGESKSDVDKILGFAGLAQKP